jgi:hypothetical protein
LWALYVFIPLFVLIAILLCMPVDFWFKLNTRASPKFSADFGWLFGLIKFTVNRQSEEKKPLAATGKQVKPAKQRKAQGTDWRIIVSIVRIRGLFKEFFRFISRSIRLVEIKKLAAELRIGLEDPVDTGYLFALSAPLNYAFSLLPFRINIEPVYESELVLDLKSEGSVRVYPFRVVGNILRFVFSAPGRRLTWLFLSGKLKAKK